MWDTVGRVCSCRMRDVRALGGVEVSAMGRSGVSRMIRVARWGVLARAVTADVSVDLRCARSGDVRVECPMVALWAVGCGGAGEGAVELGARRTGCATGGGGPLAGTMRLGGPRAGSVCPSFCGGWLKLVCEGCGRGNVCDCCACASPMTNPLSPSTNANLFSRFSLSRSNPAPFLASCLQKS